jgi:hypothetical protein
MLESSASQLFVISNAEALAWVLGEKRVAFSRQRARTVERLTPGSRLFLYATSRCFRGKFSGSQIIGEVSITGKAQPMDTPVTFGDYRFSIECPISIIELAPIEQAPKLPPLVPQLHAFKDMSAWHLRLRGALVPLDDHDYELLSSTLSSATEVDTEEVISNYASLARQVSKGH